jgi:hypothetical protein
MFGGRRPYPFSDDPTERFMCNPMAQKMFAQGLKRRADEQKFKGNEIPLERVCAPKNIIEWGDRVLILLESPQWIQPGGQGEGIRDMFQVMVDGYRPFLKYWYETDLKKLDREKAALLYRLTVVMVLTDILLQGPQNVDPYSDSILYLRFALEMLFEMKVIVVK